MKNSLFILLLILISGCSQENKIYIDTKQAEYIRNKFDNYKYVYHAIGDTLLAWKRDTLANSKQYFFNENYKIDSLILFNEDTTRLFTNLLERNLKFPGTSSDYITQLAGAKINTKWYFFFGPSIVIDRASYQDSVYAPLSFAELSYLAREHLRKALYRDSDGLIKAHDDFFNIIQGKYTNDSLFELHVLDYNRRFQLGKIDKIELEEIKKEISSSIQPPEPSDTRNWFQKKFGPKKLFETKEWKEYIGNKNMGK